MNFIYGKNCTLGYEDEYGNYQEQELKDGKKYRIRFEIEAEYVEFNDDGLIFEVRGNDIDIPAEAVIGVEEL